MGLKGIKVKDPGSINSRANLFKIDMKYALLRQMEYNKPNESFIFMPEQDIHEQDDEET